MPIQDWTPINGTIIATDEYGIHTFEVIQLPLLPPKHESPPPRRRLGDQYFEADDSQEKENSVAPPAAIPPTPTAKPKKCRAGNLQDKYQDYPPSTPDQEIIEGNPDLIYLDNLFRLAKNYTIPELTDAINESHGNQILTHKALSNRLTRSVELIAQRDGREREEVLQEMRQAKKENGVKGTRRKRKSGEDEGGEKLVKKQKVQKDEKDGLLVELEKGKENVDPEKMDESGETAAMVSMKPDREVTASGFIRFLDLF